MLEEMGDFKLKKEKALLKLIKTFFMIQAIEHKNNEKAWQEFQYE